MPEAEPIPDIRELGTPPEVADPLQLWVVLAIAGGTLLFVGALIALFVWRGRRIPPPAPASDPRAEALDRLHMLKRDYAQIAPPEFGASAISALRLVLADRFGGASLNQTPDEFFERHAQQFGVLLGPGRDTELAELLNICDGLRFAPGRDSHSVRLPLAERAIDFVRDLPDRPHPTSPKTSTKATANAADAHPAAA